MEEYEKFTWCIMRMDLFQDHEKGAGVNTNLISRLKILLMKIYH